MLLLLFLRAPYSLRGGGGVQGKFFWRIRFKLWAPQVPLIIGETFGEVLGYRRPTIEEQFGAPFAPLGPSGGNDYFTPIFWAGRSSETVRHRGPRTSPKVSPIIRGTCGAQSSNLILQKNLPWTPPPPPPLRDI